MAPGALQIIVIILLVMVLFGAGRIPVVMENIAKGIKSFKKGLKEEDEIKSLERSAGEEKSPDEPENKAG